MAELTATDTATHACCAAEQQATCCEPSTKADCCHDGGCGCDDGSTATQASDLHEHITGVPPDTP